jgi:deoxyribonuclease-4
VKTDPSARAEVRRIGGHMSTAGALENAAISAHEAGGNCVQIFSGSPRTWTNPMPRPEAVRKLLEARARLDVNPLVIHANYLINLAGAEPANRAKSIAAFRGELERALAIGAEYLVLHPGSYKNQTLEEGLERFAEALADASAGIKSARLTLLLENTAGAGSAIGSRFAELAELHRLARNRVDYAIGYCIDTCHSLAAGYDIASPTGLESAVSELDAALGLGNVPVLHANDSKGALGSRLDRHAHIGEGYIGLKAFERILNHPRLRGKAFILETPVDGDGDYARNISILKRLCRKSRTTTIRSS